MLNFIQILVHEQAKLKIVGIKPRIIFKNAIVYQLISLNILKIVDGSPPFKILWSAPADRK